MPPKMRILFMTENFEDTVCIQAHYYLEQAIGKIAQCRWAGAGHPHHQLNENMAHTINRVMSRVNWVIYYDFGVMKRQVVVDIPPKGRNRRYKVAAYVGDLHREPKKYVRHLNNCGWDALLMAYTELGRQVTYETKRRQRRFVRRPIALEQIPKNYYKKNLKIPFLHMAPNVSPEMFRPFDEPKQFDATFLGAVGLACYPLRNDIWRELPEYAEKMGWNSLLRRTPPGPSLDRKISRLQGRHLVGERYARALSASKIFIFGTSVFNYPLLKFFEGMACKTCVMADTPLHAEELHLVPDWNFVAINRRNWKEKLKYYLENDDEREEIAQRGYETVMKYHTSDVRAREVVDFLREYIWSR